MELFPNIFHILPQLGEIEIVQMYTTHTHTHTYIYIMEAQILELILFRSGFRGSGHSSPWKSPVVLANTSC